MTHWRNVVVMSATILCTITGIFCWYRVLANHLRELGATPLAVSVAFCAAGLLNRVPQLAGGRLANLWGRKLVIVAATFTMGACFLAMAYAPNWPLLVLAWVICWTAGGIQWPAILTLISESVEVHRRSFTLGIIEALTVLGVTIGPLIGSFLEERYEDKIYCWRVLLLICAGMYFVSAVTRMLLLRETHHTPAPKEGDLPVDWRSIAIPSAIGVVATVLFFLTLDGPIGPLFLEDALKLKRHQIDKVFVLYGAIAFLSAFLAGWMTNRHGPRKSLGISFIMLFGLLVPIAGTHFGLSLSRTTLVCLLVAVALPAEIFTVAFQRLQTSEADPRRRAANVGGYGLIIGLVAPWSYLAGGHVYTPIAPAAPFVGAAVAAALAVVLTLKLERRLKE